MKLFTIGYGGRSPQQILDMLAEHDIKLLIDVRISPRTRVPGFSKQSLADFMPRNGVRYQHIQALGNANYQGDDDAPVLLVDQKTGMTALELALRDQPAAIMCACRKPDDCHRKFISDLAQSKYGVETVTHLV